MKSRRFPMKKFTSKLLISTMAILLLLVGGGVLAQPVIAEMKIKVFETWIEFVYDVTPGTSGDSIVMTVDGANSTVNVLGDLDFEGGAGAVEFTSSADRK